MIEIRGVHTPSCKIFINGELFIDQKLPWRNNRLVCSTKVPITEIRVENTSNYKIVANGVKIRPGKAMLV
jgi:hypothetical protein